MSKPSKESRSASQDQAVARDHTQAAARSQNDQPEAITIHSKLVSGQQLVRRLETTLGKGNFRVEMRNNLYHVNRIAPVAST
jgi:hypothetical protein